MSDKFPTQFLVSKPLRPGKGFSTIGSASAGRSHLFRIYPTKMLDYYELYKQIYSDGQYWKEFGFRKEVRQ
jgi:hypothetical protein